MGIPRIVVRGAVEADRAGVLGLAPRLAEGVAPWRDQERAKAAGERWLADSLGAAARGEGIVLVAVDDTAGSQPSGGTVVGAISVRPMVHFTGEHDGYVGELVVAERSGRRGIGRRLVEAASAWARDQGLVNLSLHTGASNANARAFYAALGFAEEEVRLTLRL
ncbi:MAG TPA: GNAT family N-acetyltransferase [Trebonia sp.]|jgi:ribosomal protein S18 acetylase RimI-like enzyme|nr:GNAT family N-acetyltransferase [Trebonia sp.]